jgi:translocation and assembly module TamB
MLSAPATFRYADRRFTLSEACWRLVDGGGGCLEGDLDERGALSIDGKLEALPLGPLAARFGSAIVPDQEVSGELSFRRAPGELPSGVFSLDLTEGNLRSVEDPQQALETGAARLDLVLEEGQLQTGVFNLPLPGVGGIEASLQGSGVRLDGSGRLRGKALLQITDLAPIAVLLPDVQRVTGEMTVEVDLTGTVGEPFIDGLVRLVNVSFAVPFLGLTVTDLNGEGYARGQGEAALQAEFRAGEGAGRLLGDVDLTPGKGWPFIFRVEGENLRLVETPDIELDANPAFDLSWADGAWTIDGSLEVPRLRLTPRSTMVGQVSESDDVVIVAGELPEAAPAAISDDTRIFGQLQLRLGEDVTLETDAAQARVGGQLDLSWTGPPEPRADGALKVQGEIEIFGPVLRISDGNLRFPGVPVSNPALDLRAERDVFGNTQIRAAGVAIGGTARRPSIEAYTRPYTTRDRAWALLITGQDFDQGQGISALEVGAYIAPRVYVSYGVSLFDEENVASVRYDLGRGFGVKATSGVRQTGVDISYTIEKD